MGYGLSYCYEVNSSPHEPSCAMIIYFIEESYTHDGWHLYVFHVGVNFLFDFGDFVDILERHEAADIVPG